MRPEVERPEPGENGISGKSEFEVEFERAEVDREVATAEAAQTTEMIDVQEISEQAAAAGQADTNPTVEPQ
jgi:hypothetical protein